MGCHVKEPAGTLQLWGVGTADETIYKVQSPQTQVGGLRLGGVKRTGRTRGCQGEGAEGHPYLQVVPQDTSLAGPQMLHQLRIRVLITHHGGAHFLQGKPRWLPAWLPGHVEGLAPLRPLPANPGQTSREGWRQR